MRIEKPSNGLYQAKLAQDQIVAVNSDIEIVNSNLVSSTGTLSGQISIVNNSLISASSALDAKIDSSASNLRVRYLNSFNQSTPFTSTSTAPSSVGFSVTTYDKKYSTTELRVAVFIVATSNTTLSNNEFADISYSINNGSTWLGATRLRGTNYSAHNTADQLHYMIHYNLGVLPEGTVNFRLGANKTSSAGTLYIFGLSYQFIEAMENA